MGIHLSSANLTNSLMAEVALDVTKKIFIRLEVQKEMFFINILS